MGIQLKKHMGGEVVQGEMRIVVAGLAIRVSVYLVDGMLVDTGPGSQRGDLEVLLGRWDFGQVVVTHHHEDHVGMARWIQETKGVPIWMHRSGVALVEKPVKLPFYRRVYWGERAPFRAAGLGDVVETDRYRWEVVHTPGHAHDHVVFWNRENGWILGGDLFVNPRPRSAFAFESVPLMIDSLQRVLALDFEMFFCAHQGMLQDGREALTKKLDYLVGVEQQILELHGQGVSAREIRRRMFGKRQPIEYFSRFENAGEHLIRSVLV